MYINSIDSRINYYGNMMAHERIHVTIINSTQLNPPIPLVPNRKRIRFGSWKSLRQKSYAQLKFFFTIFHTTHLGEGNQMNRRWEEEQQQTTATTKKCQQSKNDCPTIVLNAPKMGHQRSRKFELFTHFIDWCLELLTGKKQQFFFRFIRWIRTANRIL